MKPLPHILVTSGGQHVYTHTRQRCGQPVHISTEERAGVELVDSCEPRLWTAVAESTVESGVGSIHACQWPREFFDPTFASGVYLGPTRSATPVCLEDWSGVDQREVDWWNLHPKSHPRCIVPYTVPCLPDGCQPLL